jgi:serine protease
MRFLVAALLVWALIADAAAAAGDPLRARQWNLTMVEADAAHATSTGVGATVAIVDSGVAADHPDLRGRLVAGHDFVDGDATPQDGEGHGTHVTGIVGAATGNGVGVASVAPGARLMPVRVLDDVGSGNVDDIAAGIDWARTHGADVINLSLGSEVPIVGATGGDAIDAAIRRALAGGVVVVAAAGNNGVPVCEQPAASAGLVCVGAVDGRRTRSLFSSFGSGLAVVAPGGSALPTDGENVLSTVPPATYEEMAGTSQAAPHVSGVAALLVSLGLHGRAAVDRLLATATDLGPPGVDAQYGHGLVNARAAVARVDGAAGRPDAASVRARPAAPAGAQSRASADALGGRRAREHPHARTRPRGRPRNAPAAGRPGSDGDRAAVPPRTPGGAVPRARPRAPAGRAPHPRAQRGDPRLRGTVPLTRRATKGDSPPYAPHD